MFKYFANEATFVKGRNVATISSVSKYYMVSFEVYPTSYQGVWANVIHMSVGKDNSNHGDRYPAVWFHPASSGATSNKLRISSSVGISSDYQYNSVKSFSLNTWLSVKIQQTEEGGKAMYRIYLNGEMVHEVENTHPKAFDNVMLYVSDPWYAAQDGKIRNLIIDTQGSTGEKVLTSVSTGVKLTVIKC